MLLAAGFAAPARNAQVAGLVAVVATSAKLLLFDMDAAGTIWRIGLFMAIGTALLVMSDVATRRQRDGHGE